MDVKTKEIDTVSKEKTQFEKSLEDTQANLKQIQKDFDEKRTAHTKLVRDLRDEVYRIGNEKETYGQNIKILKNQLTFKQEEIDDADRKLKE